MTAIYEGNIAGAGTGGGISISSSSSSDGVTAVAEYQNVAADERGVRVDVSAPNVMYTLWR